MNSREEAAALGVKIDGRWSAERVNEEIALFKAKSAPAAPVTVEVNKFADPEFASAHAAKIWEGQSPSLSMIERVARIRAALKDKGFKDFDKLVLPTKEDYKRYL